MLVPRATTRSSLPWVLIGRHLTAAGLLSLWLWAKSQYTDTQLSLSLGHAAMCYIWAFAAPQHSTPYKQPLSVLAVAVVPCTACVRATQLTAAALAAS